MSSSLPTSSDLRSPADAASNGDAISRENATSAAATVDAVSTSGDGPSIAPTDSMNPADPVTEQLPAGHSTETAQSALVGALAGTSVLSRHAAPKLQDLASRRQQLKAQRRHKFYTIAWRTVVVGSVACGLVWLAKSPIWLIRSAEQVKVENNQLLSDDNVRSLLSIPYPQSFLEMRPDDLADRLTAYDPIADAVVSRQLLPPGLSVNVIERIPVAIAIPEPSAQSSAERPVPFRVPGVIDAEGYWMPYNSYAEIGSDAELPALTVKGMQVGYESAWQTIYRGIIKSPVSITSVDWTRKDNLILRSELGLVHMGALGNQFEAQLVALDQLRDISDTMTEDVAYFDLRDPENPVIETVPTGATSTDEEDTVP